MKSEWKTIGSAPKTGERVILFFSGGGMVFGRWESDRFAKNPKPYWTSDMMFLNGVRRTREIQPTHWMPLPTAPEETP